ncbi:MAG: hypothetical protein HC880_22110 [Bacteroidia bacterium]|nr:hypothetical protein [Bacteroidia bacterium]
MDFIPGWGFVGPDCTTSGPAQGYDPELLTLIADEACQCLQSVDMLNNTQEADQLLENCMQQSMMRHAAELLESTLIHDKEVGKQMGNEIAKILFQNCPAFVDFSMKLAEEERSNTAQGKLISIETKPLMHLIIEVDQKLEKYIWLRPVSGSYRFIDSPKKYIGKNLLIEWKSVEWYNPRSKDYVKDREIQVLKFWIDTGA